MLFHVSRMVVFKLKRGSESHEGLDRTQIAGPSPQNF